MATEESIYYAGKVFEKDAFPAKGSKDTQFEDCTFKNCDLTEINFSGCDFSNCSFSNCNISMVKFGRIGFDKVTFSHCKMVGADFSNTKDFLFSADFEHCILDYAAFMKKKNRKSRFEQCSLKGTDFSESDFSSAIFDRCDMSGAVFMRTVLNDANFVTSYNFMIDPEKNQLRKARFATNGLAGLLVNYGIIVEES